MGKERDEIMRGKRIEVREGKRQRKRAQKNKRKRNRKVKSGGGEKEVGQKQIKKKRICEDREDEKCVYERDRWRERERI